MQTKLQKIRKKLLKNWHKSVILGQFLAFVTLTFKRLFLDIMSLFLNTVVLCNVFLKKNTDLGLVVIERIQLTQIWRKLVHFMIIS